NEGYMNDYSTSGSGGESSSSFFDPYGQPDFSSEAVVPFDDNGGGDFSDFAVSSAVSRFATVAGIRPAAVRGADLGALAAAATQGKTSDYSATINWGDGVFDSGIVSATAGGGFAVIGTHHYDRSGNYMITVSDTDIHGAEVSESFTANVIPSVGKSSLAAQSK